MSLLILLKPTLLGFKNRLRRQQREHLWQNLSLLCGILILALSVYYGTDLLLDKIYSLRQYLVLPATHSLGLVLFFLILILLVSNLAAAIGCFFLAADLDLVLAAPISNTRFFLGRFLLVILSSSWMPFLFLLPLLLAYATNYNVSFLFYLTAPLLLIPFFTIPAAIAVIVAAILLTLVPARRARELVLVASILLVYHLIKALQLLAPSEALKDPTEQALHLITMLSMPYKHWLPSTWLARAFQQLLEPGAASYGPEIVLLFSSAIGLTTLAFITILLLHPLAYTRVKTILQGLARRKRHKQTRNNAAPVLALMTKEARLLIRDLSQVFQIVLLGGLGLIYLYNVQGFIAVQYLPDDIRSRWLHLLVIGNLAVGSFIATALCTRLVFPSVSLEGRAYWILQAAPLSLRDILVAKSRLWLLPITSLASVFFLTGAFALRADSQLTLLTFYTSILTCYGLVGVAVGLGAHFANFDWEFPSQLIASFGSFIFMLCALGLILINIALALGLVILIRSNSFQILHQSYNQKLCTR